MSHIVYHAFWVVLIFLGSCNTSPTKEHGKREAIEVQNSDPVMITERFNIQAYQKRKEEETTEFNEDDGTFVQQLEVGKGSEINYIEYRTPPPPALFKSFKRYHGNGVLKIEGKKFHSDFNYGVWKTYDTNGVLVEEKDYEEPYALSFEEFLTIVQAHHKEMEIPEVDILNNRTTITRQETSEGNIWNFSWEAIPGRIEIFKFSDKTGELLQESHYELMDN